MLVPWRITRGPHYEESVESARAKAGNDFDENLAELERRIRINPAEATAVVDEDHRVLQIFDDSNGYSLALYVGLDRRRHECRLEWVETIPPGPEFDPWDDP